jgi:selT/selW/selH-like putative selenoprotein
LKHSSGGVFEVTVDGNLIFSKKATGEFPDEKELIEKIRTQGSSASVLPEKPG